MYYIPLHCDRGQPPFLIMRTKKYFFNINVTFNLKMSCWRSLKRFPLLEKHFLIKGHRSLSIFDDGWGVPDSPIRDIVMLCWLQGFLGV